MRRTPKHSSVWIDVIELSVAGHDGYPESSNLCEACGIEFVVEAEISRDELLNAIERTLDGKPYALEEKRSFLSWGADGLTVLQILIDTSSGIGGVAGIVYLLDLLEKVVTKRVSARRPTNSGSIENSVNQARQCLAKCLRVETEAITVHNAERRENGTHVMLQTSFGVFAVDVGDDQIRRIKKQKTNQSKQRSAKK